MTIEVETGKVTRAGNGVATSFSFSPLVIFRPDPDGDGLHDLEVTKVVVATGVETVITEGTGAANFTVVMTDTYPGTGSITYPSTGSTRLETGESLIIKRKLKLLQPIDLENQGGYFPDTLEQGLDRPTMTAIQQQEEIDRAVKVPIGSTATPEDFYQSLLDTATAAEASATAAASSATDAQTAETNAETAETNAEAAATAAAASALAAAGAAASGLFATLSNKSADFTIVADTDNATQFIVDSSGGSVVVTLPSIATAGEGERYGFLRTSASNSITLTRNGSDTINGLASNYTMAAASGDLILLLADDASPDNWIVVNWSQALADESTLEKVGNTIRVKDLGVSTAKIAASAVTGPKLGGGAIPASTGFTATSYSAGTKSSGTYTPAPANGNFQYATNGGAHTLAPPASDCTMIVQYTNNGSAGAVTTSGFSKVSGSFTTTNGDDFMCYIARLNGFTHLNIVALQ